MCRSSSEGYDVACFMGLVPVWGKGKWERRTGTKLLAVFLQHICSEVNTRKGIVSSLILIDSFAKTESVIHRIA
jgi:hypothetical protein